MIPTQLGLWTLDAVRQLVTLGAFEGDRFEFKEMLPHKQDEGAKDRLRKTCAAFANTFGGFIVFGVKDQRDLSVDARLEGIEAHAELPRDFGNFPSTCHPSVDWSFLTTPLRLPSGNAVHVIHIPRSPRAPHAVRHGDDWYIPKRTNKGNEPMSIEEIRSVFTADAEMRRHLKALKGEIEFNVKMWRQQRQNVPNVSIQAIMTRALEDFIRSPFLETKLSVDEAGFIWQHAKNIDRMVELLLAPLKTQPFQDGMATALNKSLDEALGHSAVLLRQLNEVIKYLA